MNRNVRKSGSRSAKVGAALVAVGLAVLGVGVGAGAVPRESTSSTPTTEAAGDINTDVPQPGDSTEIIAFVRTSSDTYQAAWQRGMKAAAEANGLTITFIENNADQTEQNSQVQQQVGSGAEPAAWVWMPADAQAGAASLKLLYDTGLPVFQVNQLPPEGTEQYVTAYAGVNDVINGRASGELILQARDQLVADGALEQGAEAQLAVIMFYPEFAATTDRLTGFHEVIDGQGITIAAEADNAVDATTGYDATSSIMPLIESEGVQLLYAQNDASAAGAIQALVDGGLTPGEDVLVVGGNCRDDVSDLVEGRQFGTGLQAAELEGQFSAQMIANYIANPGIAAGEYEAPADPDALPDWPATISQYNFLPNPPVLGTEVESTRLWGFTMEELCSY